MPIGRKPIRQSSDPLTNAALPTDQLTRIMFERVSARALLVQLDQQWLEISRRHDAPAEVMSLLGQMTAASVLLSASLKYEGAVVLQIHGDGPVRLAVSECAADLGFRSTIKMSESLTVPLGADWTALVNQNGLGRFSVVLDPKLPDQQPYQGIVSLDPAGVAASLEHYMAHSEQLATRLWLFSEGDKAAGLLLQRMPSEGGSGAVGTDAEEDWQRLIALAQTVTKTELLTADPQTLLHQLFWQEKPKLIDERAAHFFCSCSRARVGRMLRSFGTEEIAAMLKERDIVDVHCDFCNTHYTFDAVDCAQLFTVQADPGSEPPPTVQ